MDETQAIYRGVSQSAFCFIIELEEKAIGECWLQEMNLDAGCRINERRIFCLTARMLSA
jgi:hypothetical protein